MFLISVIFCGKRTSKKYNIRTGNVMNKIKQLLNNQMNEHLRKIKKKERKNEEN